MRTRQNRNGVCQLVAFMKNKHLNRALHLKLLKQFLNKLLTKLKLCLQNGRDGQAQKYKASFISGTLLTFVSNTV